MQKNQVFALSYYLKDNDLLMEDTQAPRAKDLEKKYVLRFKDLPEEEKPREKLIKYGPSSLKTSELIAILLNFGTKKEDVLSMANRIFKEYGEKTIANQKNPKILEKELDLPLVKSCQLVACFELGRRFFQTNHSGNRTIRTAAQAYEYFKEMGNLPKEHLRGIYLNSHFKVIHDEVISVGSLTANIIHPREVFRPAIENSAAAVIIAHNHPSGDPQPTSSDIEITKQLVESGKIIGIDLLDHLVIGKNKFTSITENYS